MLYSSFGYLSGWIGRYRFVGKLPKESRLDGQWVLSTAP